VGASIGIALNEPDDDTDSILRNADVAMYSVKTAGRARYDFYATDMLHSVVDRVELGQEMRRAVENQEFVVHFQPMVEMRSGAIRGVEALVRWQHPTRGLLSPGEFLGVAEETGAITAIGQWVLDNSCRQVAEWNDMFEPLEVSVNLSPTQVLHPGIVDLVANTLATTGLDPSMLVLELTEAVMVRDKDLAAQRLYQLKGLGVRLAIDDFGTGYSSLAYLRQLPFDILKIDKGFVDGVTNRSTESALTRAILTLAETLDMVGIAEGVEHREQAGILQELGCHFAQGFLFSRPLPADQVAPLLRRPSRRAITEIGS
jgi:EAL domain-containing protein (putative c-di-GMP-specific phosphodiesterase class I)